MPEGRRRVRNFQRLLVQIFSEEKPLVGEACPTQNLNSLGARLITERSWRPNSRVIVKSSDGDLWARARVVYCQPVSRKAFAVGLEFFVLTGELVMRV
jgi:PilZ domain